MSIISKIGALKITTEQIDDELFEKTKQLWRGRNAGINDALAIIKSEFEEKEQPDGEGWWLRKTPDKADCMVFIELDNSNADYPAFHFWEAGTYHYHYTGKWVKAIVSAC